MKNMQNDGAVMEECPISIISMDAWEWPQGVALFAMYQYYRESGDRETLSWLLSWFDAQLDRGLPSQNINTTCPMLTLAFLYEETGRKRYLDVLKQWLDFAMNGLPRTGEGGLQHVVSGNRNEGQLWDDTLYSQNGSAFAGGSLYSGKHPAVSGLYQISDGPEDGAPFSWLDL